MSYPQGMDPEILYKEEDLVYLQFVFLIFLELTLILDQQ